MPFPSTTTLYPSPTLYPGTSPNGGGGGGGGGSGIWDGEFGDLFTRGLRSGVAIWYTVDAYRDGAQVIGDLRPTGGTVTDTTKPGVRRLLNLELAPEPGLFDLLSPTGTELHVIAHVQFTDRSVVDTSMGWFDVDTETLAEGGGALSLTAPDRWVRISRARFIRPKSSVKGRRVVDEITSLIRGALGGNTEVIDTSGSQAKVAALTYERDRDKAIIDQMTAAGLWVFFDRDGVATIARQPTGNAAPTWRADASKTGVLVSLDRERSRAVTRNVVVVESSAADAPAFSTVTVWDANPDSPTFAGTNPITSPGSAGPFGVVPYFFDTPLPLSSAEARQTALTILARTIGLASQVSIEQAPDPRIEAFSVGLVLPPRERYDMPRVLERHVADTVTHPLTLGPLRIEGRSTRTDQYVSEG